jgi:phosphoribosyl 1,2-cyclic phosphodiesterase
MLLRFLSLASGSEGNCYYIGTAECGILIDAGIGCRSIGKILKNNGIEPEQLMALFVTHDHTDHIRAVGSLSERFGLPVYATPAVHAGIASSRYSDVPTPSRRILRKDEPVSIGPLIITAFDVPHDAADCVGYRIRYADRSLVLATDVGHITPVVGEHICKATDLIIETNYDRDLLLNGSYPAALKARIMNGSGHLCNTETAEFLAANFPPQLRNIWLCHLSRHNNHPELARDTVQAALDRQGLRTDGQIQLAVLRQNTPSELYDLI